MCKYERVIRWGTMFSVAAATGMWQAQETKADGYYYVPQSYYVAPPLVYNAAPIFRPAPIVVYQPVQVAPSPVVGHYYPLPAPVGRVRESGYSFPHRSRYRFEYDSPSGVEYKYRYKRDGGYVRVREKWDD